MKKIIIVLMITLSVQSFAGKWYVASSGNNGAIGNLPAFPLLTISHAADIAGNDTIYIMGSNTVTSIAYLKLHTSVMAYDTNAKIISTITGGTVFSYYSATIVNGSTSQISGIEFDGQNIAYGAIMSSRVGGMTIKDNYIHDFRSVGIHLYNPAEVAPTCVGTKIYNNTITNCARYLGVGSYGNIWAMGQKNLIVRKNIVTASFITGDSAGFAFKASHLENSKIDSNQFLVINHNDGVGWAFSIESNHNYGGVEYCHNTLQGIVDFSGNNYGKGTYEYCVSVHDNLIGHPELTQYWQLGIIIEAGVVTRDILIYNNITRNVATALSIYHKNTNLIENVKYHHNLIYNVGRSVSGGSGYAINISGNFIGSTVRNVELDNNTIIGATNGTAVTALAFSGGSKLRNVKFRNNITFNFPNAPILTPSTPTTGSIDSLYLQNNLIFNCGNSNNPRWYGITPTNLTNTGVIKSDPLFLQSGNYKIQTLSPAINSGLSLGYTSDILGATIDQSPDVGAYEYISNILVPATVILDPPYNTTSGGVTIYAYVAISGTSVSSRGIVWSTSQNPTVSNYKIAYGNGLGVYKIFLDGLKASTTYYLRAYAVNEAGTSYSNQVIINTTYTSKVWDKGRVIRDNGKIIKF